MNLSHHESMNGQWILTKLALFKKNQRHFDILTPIKDWKDGDVIQYNYFTPGVYGSFISKTKIIPSRGEDYLQVPEEITKYTDDMMSMYQNLIDNYCRRYYLHI